MKSELKISHVIYRLAIVLALFAWGTPSALAQQPPDCNICGCNIPGMQGVTYSLSTSPAAVVCPTNVTYDMNVGRFIRFYAVVGNVYSFSLCNQPDNTVMYITTNTATPGVITCDDDGCGVVNGGALITFVPAATNTYRLYVFNAGCGAPANIYPDLTMMPLVINCAPVPVPVNNLPCTATVLPTNSTACNYISSTNLGATNSGLAPPAPCNGAGSLYQGADVWFQVQVPPTGLLGIQTVEGDICAGMFQIYSSNNGLCSGTLTPVANGCSAVGLTGPLSEPAIIFDAFQAGLAAGATVWVRYWERNGNENGGFQICAFMAERPVNDEPCDALPLPLNTTCISTSNTFTNASASSVPNPTCGNTAIMNDIWYSFTVPAPFPPNWTGISVNTQGNAPLDLAQAWYRMTPPPCAPGSLTQIACSPTGSVNSAFVNPNLLVAGETIYVRLWGENPWIGTYEICAVINQAPANDDPCGAIALDLNYGCLMTTYSNLSSTNTPTMWAPAPTCFPATNDVWFTVTVPPNGVVQFDTQSGSMTNAAMAVYSSTGSCATNNLNLTQIACQVAGSQQGAGSNQMPYIAVTNQPPGATLYIRVWRQGGSDGTFGLCARRTDIPPGNCFYTLNMFDSAGDGWGGSFVTVCVAGNCTNYTVTGLNASVSIGVNVGQIFTISYTSAGGFENQNSYTLTQFNSTVFAANSPPQTGLVFTQSVSCDPPPSPQSDCFGAMSLCNQATLFNQQPIPGTQELNVTNRGCLLGNEHWGLWYSFQIATAGNIAFTISPSPNADFDFAVWGPYPPGSNIGNICPVSQLPLRCNFSGVWGPTGLQVGPTTAPFSPHIVANVGEVYILYVDQWTTGPNIQFNLSWDTGPGTASLECTFLPVSLVGLDAYPSGSDVMVEWSTASEQNSAWFDVERSADGVDFTQIGRVAAAGYAQHLNKYRFVDGTPMTGLSYYRLKQVDTSNEFAHSSTVAVLMKGNAGLEVYPNPVEGTLFVGLSLESDVLLSWRINDMSGRLVEQGSIAGVQGRTTDRIAVDRLEQGSYILEVKDQQGNPVGVARFIKQ